MSKYVAKSILESKGETKIYNTLVRYNRSLVTQTGVRFFRIIDAHIPGLTISERDYLYMTEFDFIVADQHTHQPLFGIDWDGIGGDYLKFDERRPWKKAAKQKACELAGFPFVWMETFGEIEGTSILDAMIESFLGGRAVSELVRDGVISWEEQFCYDFPPFSKMTSKYGHYVRKNEFGPWLDRASGHSIYTFGTDDGCITIERTARVSVVNFPHFHSYEVASDLASYRCFLEFERRIKSGEVSVKKIR